MNDSQLLIKGIEQLNIRADKKQISALKKFISLLQKWNQTYNLTAIEEQDEIISKHILDSLSIRPYLAGKKIIDVGSGAGLPGIPLAILCPDKDFVLIDANVKKTRFIQQAIIEIGINNATVVNQRVEEHNAATEYGTVVSRAFAASHEIFASIDHLITRGRVILMLGKQKQFSSLPNRYNELGVHTVCIPNLQASRHIAVLEKT